ncbi:carboxypeptidase-like regulatory domain-containing protein [Oligoflexus tunisiensis]|uniref:carboxypeptidase-like regulatory domain-containing protein n=1 Tax=Oligoflexus tunisiensis TaxID=708132 RepID=UPI00114CBD4C|nr:carboxypeptidase-like regulatory domain-containing protein [Oligoflexus tunisiensis]
MMKWWFLFSLWLVTGCLPQPDSEVTKAQPELVVQGRAMPGLATLSGNIGVYIEQDRMPEAITREDGSFAFSLDGERLEALRLQYGLQDPRLHLYFVSESGFAESAVLDVLNIQSRGVMDLGDVVLQPDTTVNGRVVASGAPVADARVRLGRQEVFTAVDGTFSATVPAQLSTPLLVEKRGFVQTKGTWLPGGQARDVELYNDLTPAGSIEALPVPRILGNEPISLSYSANGAARWIRFAGSPEALTEAYNPEAPWQDLRQPLQIMGAEEIYYQFADRDRKILGPVQSYTLTVAQE